MKAPTSAFTFKTLLRHYAKRALTTRSLNMKLGPRRNYHKGRAGWLAKCLIAAPPLISPPGRTGCSMEGGVSWLLVVTSPGAAAGAGAASSLYRAGRCAKLNLVRHASRDTRPRRNITRSQARVVQHGNIFPAARPSLELHWDKATVNPFWGTPSTSDKPCFF